MKILFVILTILANSAFSQIKLNPSYKYSKDGKSISYNKGLKFLQSGDYVADISDESKTVKIIKPKGMEIGDPFSFKTVFDINGNQINKEDIRGKSLVINYWFTGCRPCVMEMPELNKIVEEFKNEDIIFLAYANDIAPKVSSFLSKRPFNYTIIPGQMTATLNKGITIFPTHIFVNKDGIITGKFTGYSEGVGNKISSNIQTLLK